jgi:hypothetical protein
MFTFPHSFAEKNRDLVDRNVRRIHSKSDTEGAATRQRDVRQRTSGT